MSPWHRVRLAVEILGDYVPLLRSLRRDEFPKVLENARNSRCVSVTTGSENEHETAVRLGSIVGQVLRPLPTDNRCLIRSLVLLRMLARRGIPGELVLGVHARGEHLAHAWVEHDTVPLLPVGEFEPLTRL